MNQIEEEVIKKYVETKEIIKTGNILNIPTTKVSLILKKFGINKKNQIPKLIEKTDIDNKIIELYQNGKSERDIVGILNLSSRTIVKNTLFIFDVEKRTTKQTSRKYFCRNEKFFDNIDSEEKAYWLGFLFADGYLKTNRTEIGLALVEYDKEHIISLNNVLKSTYPINIYDQSSGAFSKKNKYCRLVINNEYLYNSLKNKGFTSCKTKDKNPMLYNIPNDLKRHFIRGYFDGNGSVYMNSATNSLGFSFDGNKHIINEIKEDLIKNNIKSKFTLNQRFNTENCSFYIKANGNKISKNFYNYIYNKSTIFLHRKKEKFDSHLLEEVQRA